MATYPVRCECGKTHQVPGSAAGTNFTCDCRRTVEVPSFAKLKASVGESSVSIDLMLRHMLAHGELPVETDCAICQRITIHRHDVELECERSEYLSQPKSGSAWNEFRTFFFSGLFGHLMRADRMSNETLVGRDVVLRLPIRICKECEPDLKTAAEVRTVLNRTEVYRQLFARYPDARVR